MIQPSRAVPVDELATALTRTVIRTVRVPEPSVTIRGVVMHAPGDPPCEPDLLVLCADPGPGLPDSVAVVVRESAVAGALAAAPASTAIFAAPDEGRWSDLYDRVQWALGESVGQLAEHDAFHLADALASAVGGAVAIEDARRRVVAFSTVPGQRIDDVRRQGILGRQVPEHAEREKWYARLWRTPGVSEFTDGTESTARLAVAVRAGAEPLGSIWVVGARASLNPGADEILARSVGVVAACLAHQDHFAARSRSGRGQLLRQVLDVGSEDLGYTLPGPVVLAGMRRDGAAEERDLLDARLADILSLHAQRCGGLGLAAALDGRVYALLPAADRPRLESQLLGTITRTALPAGWIALSDPVERIDQLPAVRRQVDRLLALCHRRGTDRPEIVRVADARDSLMLAELADAVRGSDALRDGPLGRIAGYDHDHGTSYVPTLRAWFESSGDAVAAAARLHLHPNTFRYRMTRARALFGLRLEQPDERLLLHLQLRLAELQ